MAITAEQLEQACFSLISFSGSAKSDFLEAVEHAKSGDFAAAEQAIERGNEEFYRRMRRISI